MRKMWSDQQYFLSLVQCKYSLCNCKCITAIVFIEVLYCSARPPVSVFIKILKKLTKLLHRPKT